MEKTLISLITLLGMLIFAVPVQAGLSNETGASGMLMSHLEVTDSRAKKLESYLADRNSTLAPISDHIVKEADRLSIDWKMVAAIAGLESTFCKRIPEGSFNCWGWGIPTGAARGIGFSSYAHGVTTVSEGLRIRYYDRGLTTVEEVGRVYAASPTWAARVRHIMNDIELVSAAPIEKIDVYF